MAGNDYPFVAWEEHILCHERGRRLVHYFLKGLSGDLVLAVVGTERSIRHMMYVVSDDFLRAYGSEGSVNACTKWRARREVVEWLTSLVSRQNPTVLPSMATDLSEAQPYWLLAIVRFDSLANNSSLSSGSSTRQNFLPDHMGSKKLKVQSSEIEWSGDAWICAKQLKHFPAFCRDETTITVHSFVFVMTLDDHQYLGYLEDLYEDKKGQKKVKVRWFHHNQEVMDEVPQLNPHPREVFITPHVQVISAECVDGPATVLTPKHYEKCMASVAHNLSSGIHMCFRQFKNHKIKPFTLAKLRGYANQAIIASLDTEVVPKQRVKTTKLVGEDEDNYNPVRVGSKRNRNYKGDQGLEKGSHAVGNSAPGKTKHESTYPKLKFTLGSKQMDTNTIGPECQLPASFKVGKKIELLCQDSGIRGCWFQCKIVRMSQKFMKVRYDDVEDADGLGNLVESIPAYQVANPDKLGMRCPGRLTVRPRPPKDSTALNVEIGTPVDAWWSDGWWEGVVIGVKVSEDDTIQIYFPGEGRCLNIQKKMIRASKDWFGSRWVDIKPMPDILLHIPENVMPWKKLSITTAEISGSEVRRTRSEVVNEGGQGFRDLATSIDRLKIVESTKSKVVASYLNGDTNADAGSDDKSGLEEGLSPVQEKNAAAKIKDAEI